ncbi:hypothetical protein Patl1_32670 [Pistacia atlantica]|uniref:Uncharacterized protein n=1 Tax=Pistacia atlantica TaxID=434234 RepID=A0ACC1AQ14_9ROSI|nr:hypothetical protein Patl1_32670 [Pistacia atlantica]
MGNAQSPPADPRFVSASRAFTQNELEELKSLFMSLAAQSQNNAKHISSSVFQVYFGLNGPLGERMFDLATQNRKDQKLSFEDLVVAKATYEKGTKDEIEEFLYQLVDINDDGILGRSDLESVLIAMLDSIFSTKISGTGCNEESMSFEDFKAWCTLIPSARKFLGSLLMHPDPGRPGCQVPRLLHLENIDSSILLLRKEYAWHIGGALSQQELEEWKLLYHSALNGLSFNTFLGSISNDEGPTLLIIKDKEGYIYGGYASQPWEKHGDFYGDMKSFLFQLYPKAAIFRPTGANNNLQWGFDQGHSFTCTTFGSPSLSKTGRIYPEVIECWGVIKGSQKENQDAVKGTVLDRFKEDRHMLNMVGLANSSE